METVKRRFFEDPGHGWLEVGLHELRHLGIADAISSCSYRQGSFAYLEEDCDAPLYIRAQQSRGVYIETYPIHQDPTPIRDYPSYR